MKRRTLLFGLGGATAGGSALLGSGAFTAVEASRQIGISVQGDAESYLELGPCLDDDGEEMSNAAFVGTESGGRMTISMDGSANADEDGDKEVGDGVNADALTRLDNVFRVCNRGTQPICVDFHAEVLALPEDAPDHAKSTAEEGDPTVTFYLADDPHTRIPLSAADPNTDPAIRLGVGECACVGIETRTFGIDPGTQLFPDGSFGIEASANADCEGVPIGDFEPPDDGGDNDDGDDDPLSIEKVKFTGSGNGKINPDGPDGPVNVIVWRLSGNGNNSDLVSIAPDDPIDTSQNVKQALGINGNLGLVAVVFPDLELAVVNDTWDGEDIQNANHGVRSDEETELFDDVDITDEDDFREFLEGDEFPLDD